MNPYQYIRFKIRKAICDYFHVKHCYPMMALDGSNRMIGYMANCDCGCVRFYNFKNFVWLPKPGESINQPYDRTKRPENFARLALKLKKHRCRLPVFAHPIPN